MCDIGTRLATIEGLSSREGVRVPCISAIGLTMTVELCDVRILSALLSHMFDWMGGGEIIVIPSCSFAGWRNQYSEHVSPRSVDDGGSIRTGIVAGIIISN